MLLCYGGGAPRVLHVAAWAWGVGLDTDKYVSWKDHDMAVLTRHLHSFGCVLCSGCIATTRVCLCLLCHVPLAEPVYVYPPPPTRTTCLVHACSFGRWDEITAAKPLCRFRPYQVAIMSALVIGVYAHRAAVKMLTELKMELPTQLAENPNSPPPVTVAGLLYWLAFMRPQYFVCVRAATALRDLLTAEHGSAACLWFTPSGRGDSEYALVTRTLLTPKCLSAAFLAQVDPDGACQLLEVRC